MGKLAFDIVSSKLIIYIRLVYSQYNKALITQKAKSELKPKNRNGHGLIFNLRSIDDGP